MNMTEAEYRALLARRTAVPVAQPRPEMAPEDDPIATLLDAIRVLAKEHGWQGEHTFTKSGPDAGVQSILVRDTVIFALLLTGLQKLTMRQQAWLDALRRTGKVEVYAWRPSTLPAITERLARKATPCPAN